MSEKIANQVKEVKQSAKAEISLIRERAAREIKALKAAEYAAARPAQAEKRAQNAALRAERKAAEAAIPKRYSIGEEIFNSVTHGIGAGLAAAAIVLLIVRAVVYAPDDGKGFYITSFAVFGASLFVLYLMSTLYHALTPYGAKKVFAIFDHSSIYLLIAGTYTPFCLTVLRGTMGWVLFAVIWGLAVAGMTFYAIFGSRMRLLSAVTYVLMGWLVVVAFKPMSETLPWLSLVLLITGGVAYTVGCIFYALKKIKWMHSVWHLFVIAGSAFHFFSVYYSIPV
ncbi:channel protein, hemolysin III family [Treponema brennaborense DSM 12168]|uniref:Channel protein, hemolysin III family n=1 Tax=Treponema brennaborense (strain DSM 12168 / CIP 105900 / DD5/3) TaxID=906968 RepID=F4LMT7_TREBD|nr:channel protein, hemolysin III family [Treponema brennaborense DSM 12168]